AKDPEIYPLYQETRKWSLDYFEDIYKRVGSHYDRYYFESEAYELGKKNVEAGLQKAIFEKSAGAIIFPGEKFGLHNRVFITSDGNATYEGKDMGLAPLQFGEYHPDLIIHVVGPEQAGYFQVVFKALEELIPETKGKEYHLIYGWVKLKSGKMSSRSGNVVLGEWLLDEAQKYVNDILIKSASKYTKEEQEIIAETAAVAAVKYSFLKVGTKQEISFDIEESVSFEGDSGPYIQYTYARCKSVLRKAVSTVIPGLTGDLTDISKLVIDSRWSLPPSDIGGGNDIGGGDDKVWNNEEKLVLRYLYKFPEIVVSAAQNYAPNVMCKYLYDLASSFNTFYNKHSILEPTTHNPPSFAKATEDRQLTISQRLALTAATAQIIKNGLYMLGIETLEKM
ncbi:MAG: arginine--tRNA ligase, partial [Patescibacteria group bacterium]